MKNKEFIQAHEYNNGTQKTFFPKVNSLEEGLKDFIRKNPNNCAKAKGMYLKIFKKEPDI